MKNVLAIVSKREVDAALNPGALDWLVDPTKGNVDAAVLHHNLYDGGSAKPPYCVSDPQVIEAIDRLWTRQVSVMMYVHPVFWRDSGRTPIDLVGVVRHWQKANRIQGVYFDGVFDGPTMLQVCRELKALGFAVLVHDSYWMVREPNAHGPWVDVVDGVLAGELDRGWIGRDYDWYGYHKMAAGKTTLYLKHAANPMAAPGPASDDEKRAWEYQRQFGCKHRLSCGAAIRLYCQTCGIQQPPAELGL